MNYNAVTLALVSAALFGVSTPAAKYLLGSIDPFVLAGAGVGVALVRRLTLNTIGTGAAREEPLTRSDLPWLGGAIVAGGILGPILLLAGTIHPLRHTPSIARKAARG